MKNSLNSVSTCLKVVDTRRTDRVKDERPFRRQKPHNGMVRREFLEVVEFEDGGSHETTRDRY
jgi:hypothetical protein